MNLKTLTLTYLRKKNSNSKCNRRFWTLSLEGRMMRMKRKKRTRKSQQMRKILRPNLKLLSKLKNPKRLNRRFNKSKNRLRRLSKKIKRSNQR